MRPTRVRSARPTASTASAQAQTTLVTPLTITPISAVSPSVRNTAVSSLNVSFSTPINLSTFTTSAVSLTDNGGPNLITGAVSFSLVSGSTYQISGLSGLTAVGGNYSLTVNAAIVQNQYNVAGTGSASTAWLMDTTPPTSAVNSTLSVSSTYLISGSVTATDPGPNASGIASVAVYVTTGSTFPSAPYIILSPGNLNFTYQGTPNNHYYFRSIATDNAGNVESKNTIDASTFIAIPPPVTKVTSATPNTGNATFTINVSSTDAYGPGMTSFSVYVAVNSGSGYGAQQLVGTVAAGTPSGVGVYSASLTYQAAADGVSRSYEFFSVGTDTASRVEATHATPDVTVANQTFAQAPLTYTGLTVAGGLLERSYIQEVELDFNEGGAALTNLYNNILANPNNYLQLLDQAYGTTTKKTVSLSGVTISLDALDNAIELNFGSTGLGGVARGSLSLAAYYNALISADGWYEVNLNMSGGGTFSGVPHGSFERLVGDTNGDGTVTGSVAGTDVGLVTADQGLVATGAAANADVNGDGTVDATDKSLVSSAKGRTLPVNPFS